MRGLPAAVAVTSACLALTGCLELEEDVPVTPGTVPAEIEGATWEELPVAYCVVSQPEMGFVEQETMEELVRESFAAWGVPAETAPDCAGEPRMGNGRNEIAWGMLPEEGSPAHQAGQTTIRYRQSFGGGQAEIVEADIVLDADPPAGLESDECLYSTLLHEVGHFLGAQHAAPPSIMAPALTSCPQELDETDRETIRALYPAR